MPSEAVTELSEAGSMIRVYVSGSMHQVYSLHSSNKTQDLPKCVLRNILMCLDFP